MSSRAELGTTRSMDYFPHLFPIHCKPRTSGAEKRSLKGSSPVRREFHSAHRSLYRQPNPANQHAIASATQQTSKDVRPRGSQIIPEGNLIKPETIQPGVNKTFNRFDMAGTATIVTGGSQGLGLAMAEGLAEAGSKVYCIDRGDQPSQHFKVASERLLPYDGGQLHYRQADITDTKALDNAIADIAAEHQRLDGVIAAAGIMKVSPALEYDVEDARKMLDVNSTSAARQMMKYKTQGSICLVASMSGLIANKGLISPVYNASKAAVIQLARSLSMEWGRGGGEEGVDGIRVNCLSPGHIVTPMVRKNLEEIPGVRETWESENMMGRISEPEEFKGAGLFLLSKASSFMTGNNLVIDGGHTAW
ncbi:hypothetical protein D0863_06617 [Hortaea werneckii]|uniref:Uncharacterized protein n=1 Tax=Hortaea werneckii TaxID=91943 RepID=A0A3M7DYI8_HORWE|nr:hypothetical protein D0863_06617 [Hortaea werneckii]